MSVNVQEKKINLINNVRITYRPEIDGLRAVAVLSVIFYHSTKSIGTFILFPGGFLGVDIFFVISGYLITSIILNEINNTQNFSFNNFYQRRARRILPALLFVIIFSIFFKTRKPKGKKLYTPAIN